MAKDRFKTRASYDTNFKYSGLEYNPTKTKVITGTQVDTMRQMYQSDKLNSWEKKFVKNCMKYDSLSQKQKDLLNKLYKNAK